MVISRNNVFTGNSALRGSVAIVTGVDKVAPIFEDCQMRENTADGLLYVVNGRLVLKNVVIENNKPLDVGGISGISLFASTLDMENCRFSM